MVAPGGLVSARGTTETRFARTRVKQFKPEMKFVSVAVRLGARASAPARACSPRLEGSGDHIMAPAPCYPSTSLLSSTITCLNLASTSTRPMKRPPNLPPPPPAPLPAPPPPPSCSYSSVAWSRSYSSFTAIALDTSSSSSSLLLRLLHQDNETDCVPFQLAYAPSKCLPTFSSNCRRAECLCTWGGAWRESTSSTQT